MATTGKGGFGSALKGFFIVDDEKPSKTESPPKAQTGPVITPRSEGGITFSPITPAPLTPVVKPELLAHLQSVVVKRRTPFTSLLESAEKLKAIIPDDANNTRLKAAAVNVGGDKSAILQAIDIHVNDIEAEARNIDQSMLQDSTVKMNAFKAEAANTTKEADDADAEILRMQARISELSQRSVACRQAAAIAVGNVTAQEAEFNADAAALALALNTAKASLQAQKQVLASTL